MSRPRILTDEQRAQNTIDQRKASKTKTKNVSIDADLVETLNTKADELEKEFGFRPTISQTLRALLLRSSKPKPNYRAARGPNSVTDNH